MDLLTTLKTSMAEKAEQNYDAYRDLLVSSLTGELDSKAGSRFAKLVAELGFTVERVEADLETLREHARLKPIADTLPAKRAAAQALDKELQALGAEREAWITEWKTRNESKAAESRIADADVDAVVRAADRVAALTRDHWRLFGGESPEVKAKRRHVYSEVTRPGADDGTLPYVSFRLESYFGNGYAFRPEDYELVPLPSQPQAEVDELVGIINQINALRHRGGSWVAGYLLTHAEREALPGLMTAVLTVEALADHPDLQAADMLLLRHPSKTQEQHDAMVATIAKAHAKRKKRRGDLVTDLLDDDDRGTNVQLGRAVSVAPGLAN